MNFHPTKKIVALLGYTAIIAIAFFIIGSNRFSFDPIEDSCPIPFNIENDILTRSRLIGFSSDKSSHPEWRQWEEIKNYEKQPRTIEDIKKKLHNFLISLEKADSPNTHLGASGSGDLDQFTRLAICDEIAIVHQQIKNGIDPTIDYEDDGIPKIEISDQDRDLLKTIYRSCKMTCANAHRYTPGLLTRVTFSPSKEDLKKINCALEEPKHSNETRHSHLE